MKVSAITLKSAYRTYVLQHRLHQGNSHLRFLYQIVLRILYLQPRSLLLCLTRSLQPRYPPYQYSKTQA